jgi:hypothetical protein
MLLRLHAAQHRSDTGGQLAWVARFGYIVIRTEFQPDDPIAVLAPRGEHDYRHRAGSANGFEDVDSVLTRQHDIENHQIRRTLRDGLNTSFAIVHGLDFESFLRQIIHEQIAKFLIVVNHQELGFALRHCILQTRTGCARLLRLLKRTYQFSANQSERAA